MSELQPASLGDDFFAGVENAHPEEAVRWYMCVMVNLSSLNFPELIPAVWEHLKKPLLSGAKRDEQFMVARRMREALTKSCGIVGAARTGNSLRQLSRAFPAHLRETASPRSNESEIHAVERGHRLWKSIYARNPEFDPGVSVAANPDYAYIVRDVLYGRILSFDEILDDLETGYVIVSALIGMDRPGQTRHHMKGMLYNGATREDLERLQARCLRTAQRVGVVSRYPIPSIPSID